MLSSAFTANISFYSIGIALSPPPLETLAPSFGAGKPQHPYIPFAPAKSRLDLWVSNRRLCTEIRPLDDLVTGTAHQCLLSQTCKKLIVSVGACLGLPRGVFRQPSRFRFSYFSSAARASSTLSRLARHTAKRYCRFASSQY